MDEQRSGSVDVAPQIPFDAAGLVSAVSLRVWLSLTWDEPSACVTVVQRVRPGRERRPDVRHAHTMSTRWCTAGCTHSHSLQTNKAENSLKQAWNSRTLQRLRNSNVLLNKGNFYKKTALSSLIAFRTSSIQSFYGPACPFESSFCKFFVKMQKTLKRWI